MQINNILNFHFQFSNFTTWGNKVIPLEMHSQLEIRIRELHLVREKLGNLSFQFNEAKLIPAIFRVFKLSYKQNKSQFDTRELRTLTYSISYSEDNLHSILSSYEELKYALSLLESNWKNYYIIGLIDCFLGNWDSEYTYSLQLLEVFIFLKLENYDGNRGTLMSFKNNKRYFNRKNGDLILGDTIAKLNRPIQDITEILKVPENWLVYPYFSNVIITYYEKSKDKIFDSLSSLDEILLKHKSLRTESILIPRIVLQATEPKFLVHKSNAKKIALEKLKDPQNRGESKWGLVDNISSADILNLNNAKKVLLQWMAEEFIEFFFKECINDPRRRNFWVKYAKQITFFKIVGSNYIKHLLLSNQTVSKFVGPRFAATNARSDRNSALMFIIKDYLFVEFSDSGAFYAYKLSNPSAPSIEAKFFYQTSDLKKPSMNLLAYRTGVYIQQTNQEGKLGHNDGDLTWESVATYWLNNIAGINV